MTEEFNNMQNEESAQQNENGREGYRKPDYQGYRPVGRQMRPRINQRRPYNANRSYDNNSGGFRPEGFGAGLQHDGGQQRSYRPRYNNNQEGGYQPRQGYQQRNGYGQQRNTGYRPRYNNNQEEGYQPRQEGYQPRYNNGYRPRYNDNNGEEGAPQHTGNYQPHRNYQRQGGYQPRGGYQQRGGYNRQGGNYQPRQGYRPRTADYDPNAKYNLKKRIEYKEQHIDPNEPVRLNKFLANAGVCSRREADEFIQAGVVSVNGAVVTELGTKVLRTDEVRFHDQPVTLEKKVYVLLNKPKDCVTTSDDPQQRKTVMDLVRDACPERIYPVGRLDRNTTGVLLLTNDGDMASKLTHPKFLKKKVYHVYLDKNVTAHDMQQIAQGITLDDGDIHADAVEYAHETDRSQVGIEIHSGRNRIVRRIFESLGYRVVKLDRVQFAGLTKKNVRRGDWRFLTEKEVEMLRMGAFE
ncbi:pseudouridine synthase [Prevotella sp. PCHR]|uniref:Pseudouridine synthase n=1 Tax=Xylanibacter caecicola TaxID=2736294 RepID=A0ABX2B001_9BACT|nr:pseudouridine synthase [Xylanibacter caecicola]NPE24561.1 pseudouridine synthase [Xylanibacter caecicola]